MTLAPPFILDAMGTRITSDASTWREGFDAVSAMAFENVIEPSLLARLTALAARASFVADELGATGLRRVEAPQRVGAGLSILLSRSALLAWLEQATGVTPLRVVAGRLAETHANGHDVLNWHDDLQVPHRKLAIVLNLSDQPFTGGRFDLRSRGEEGLLLSYVHSKPGSMLVFAVRPGLEHRVTRLESGGPRRVFAGWILSQAERKDGPSV